MAKQDKQIQIPQTLFADIVAYFLLDNHDASESIKKGLRNKIDALIKHDLYTKYKTAPTEEQKEQARQEYLDKVGVPQSFRW